MSDPFAAPSDLASYLQTATQADADAGSGDVLDTGVATQALASASGAIRAVCGWSITQETVVDYRAPWGWWRSKTLFLPTLKLSAVSVSVLGHPVLEGWDYGWDESGAVHLYRASYWIAMSQATLPPTLTFTYAHGFDPVPDVVRAVCLEQAAVSYRNPQGLVSSTYANVTEVYAARSAPAADLGSDPRLAPYRLPALA